MAKEAETACSVQGRKLRKSIADMQSSHEAQVNAVMDKYNSLRTKVSGNAVPSPCPMHGVSDGHLVASLDQWWCLLQNENQFCALQVAEYHEALKEAMRMGSVAVGVKALHIR